MENVIEANITFLINSIKKRPFCFFLNYSIYEFDAFINGFNFYKFSHGLEKTEQDKIFEEFKNTWINSKLNLEKKHSYIQCLMLNSNNQSEALDKFFEYWDEFLVEKNLSQ